MTEGWGWLILAGSWSGTKKWHYFVDGKSLCGKYMTLGQIELEQGNDDSPDNCAECRRRLLKRKENAKTE